MESSPDDLKSLTPSESSSFVSAVESYIRYYALGSSHTARAKRLDLDHFIKFLARYRGYSSPKKLKMSDWDHAGVQRFVDDRLDRGEAPATVARRLATLKHMGRTFAEKVPGFINPAREVKSPRIEAARPKAVSKAELAQIRAKSKDRKGARNSFIRLRNETLLEFLLDTGLRADEVRLLRRSQLEDSLEWIKNVRTKGRRYRNVYITSKMHKRLAEYLSQRQNELKKFFNKLSVAQDKKLPLFISTYNASTKDPDSFLMGAKTIWRAIQELSPEQKKLHPHLLRHSYALELLDHSNDVRLVAQALGHSDVRVTMRYTERSDIEMAKALEETRSNQN